MKHSRFSFFKQWACPVLLAIALGACSTKPATHPGGGGSSFPAAGMALEKHHFVFGGGVHVDYQIKRTISALNGISCYAFITGTLNNDSNQVLSRRTVLDFNFFSGGEQSFRDLTSPVMDVLPGSRAMFEMVVSPVHKEGCVNYDRIDVALRKIVLN